MTGLASNSFAGNAIFVMIFLAVCLLIGNAPEIWRAVRFRNSSNWLITQATVEQVLTHRSTVSDGSPPTYRIEISYSYHFNGNYYSGYYLVDLCATEAQATRLVDEFPKGTIAQLRVNPAKPESSILSMDY